MPKDGRITKQSILDAAHVAVLERGFAGTSVDDIIGRAGVSRGTFFYHFPSKDDLARQLVRRHAADDMALTDRFLERAEKLASDPLQQLLVFFGLYVEMLESSDDSALAGCLFASFSYEAGLFDDDTTEAISDAVDYWRDRVGAKFDEVIAAYPPRSEVDGGTLADYAYTVFEGSMIMARVRRDRALMAEHLRLYRDYIGRIFEPEPSEVPGR